MRVERDQNGLASGLLRHSPQTLQNDLMPDVYSVEGTGSDDCISDSVNLLKIMKNIHSEEGYLKRSSFFLAKKATFSSEVIMSYSSR